jgi:hypothetical protein
MCGRLEANALNDDDLSLYPFVVFQLEINDIDLTGIKADMGVAKGIEGMR